MNEAPDIAAMVDAMARILGVELTEESRAVAIMHLSIAFELAPTFMDFPLGDEAEPAPVFLP
jgi:Protein of unknown function (DUF4089)